MQTFCAVQGTGVFYLSVQPVNRSPGGKLLNRKIWVLVVNFEKNLKGTTTLFCRCEELLDTTYNRHVSQCRIHKRSLHFTLPLHLLYIVLSLHLWVCLKLFPPLRGITSKTKHLFPGIFFQVNTLNSTTKAPTVDFFNLIKFQIYNLKKPLNLR